MQVVFKMFAIILYIHSSLLILVLSGSILEGFSLVVQLSLSLTGTFLLLALVGMSFSSDHLKRIFYGVAGLAIAPTVYSFFAYSNWRKSNLFDPWYIPLDIGT